MLNFLQQFCRSVNIPDPRPDAIPILESTPRVMNRRWKGNRDEAIRMRSPVRPVFSRGKLLAETKSARPVFYELAINSEFG